MAFDDEHPFLHADLNPLPPARHVSWGERWRRKAFTTLVPMVWGENCCTTEWYATLADIFGHCLFYPQESTAATQADLLIITGHVTEKAVPELQALVQAMPDPHYVIAVGACTQLGETAHLLGPEEKAQQIAQAYAQKTKGRKEKDQQAQDQDAAEDAANDQKDPKQETARAASGCLARPLSQLVSVDVVIPGCPPTPQAFVQGVRLLEKMIKAGYRGQRPLV